MRYVCTVCGYVYDEADNTPFADLPEDWKCPLCGASKGEFVPEGTASAAAEPEPASPAETEIRPLTAAETSALCSNLAKGCEKQYLAEQADAFRRLAAWFAAQSEAEPDPSFEQLLERINTDLEEGYPAAGRVSREEGDRGAQRSLVWSEKVTRMLRSILDRYAQEGEAMLENTGIYVCTICGFVYIGDDLPEVCPVCKVPNRKFERIGG